MHVVSGKEEKLFRSRMDNFFLSEALECVGKDGQIRNMVYW